jgi:hypothetical protein
MLTVNKQESGTPPKTIALNVNAIAGTVVYTVPVGRKFSGTITTSGGLSFGCQIKPSGTATAQTLDGTGGQYTPAYPIPIMLNAGDAFLARGTGVNVNCFLLGVEEDA